MGASDNESVSNLVGHAAAMPLATPLARTPGSSPGSRDQSLERNQRVAHGAAMFGPPRGYDNLPQEEFDQQQQRQGSMNYDYFRGRRDTSGWNGGGGGGS